MFDSNNFMGKMFGKVGSGILYLLFCWTGIPSIFALIDGIVYLCSSDENFMIKHKCRLQ